MSFDFFEIMLQKQIKPKTSDQNQEHTRYRFYFAQAHQIKQGLLHKLSTITFINKYIDYFKKVIFNQFCILQTIYFYSQPHIT